jgi:hypothetical protein
MNILSGELFDETDSYRKQFDNAKPSCADSAVF